MHHRSKHDSGFMLIELLVSATLLIILVLGIFTVLDTSESRAGVQQKRTVAANVAQAELERVRALPIQDVARMSAPKEIVEGGTAYTVTTESTWVSDGSTEAQCTTRSGGMDYMRATTRVRWATMREDEKPISMTTLFTPTAGAGRLEAGSLSVHIVDRDGGGRRAVTVTIAGSETFTGTTNSNGCVTFPFVPAGDYTLSFSQGGMVDGDGRQEVQDTVSVAQGQTNKVQYLYDQGGSFQFNLKTFRTAGSNRANRIDTRPRYVSLYANQPSGPTVIDIGSATSFSDRSRLFFPFTQSYAIYAGTCSGNTGPSPRYASASRGVHQMVTDVIVPGLDITVVDADGVVSGAQVQVFPGCGQTYERFTGSDGRLADTGFPYSSSATVCVWASGVRYNSGGWWGGTSTGSRKWQGTLANTNMTQATQATINLGTNDSQTSTTNSRCNL